MKESENVNNEVLSSIAMDVELVFHFVVVAMVTDHHFKGSQTACL